MNELGLIVSADACSKMLGMRPGRSLNYTSRHVWQESHPVHSASDSATFRVARDLQRWCLLSESLKDWILRPGSAMVSFASTRHAHGDVFHSAPNKESPFRNHWGLQCSHVPIDVRNAPCFKPRIGHAFWGSLCQDIRLGLKVHGGRPTCGS